MKKIVDWFQGGSDTKVNVLCTLFLLLFSHYHIKWLLYFNAADIILSV